MTPPNDKETDPEKVEALLPAESMALTIAKAQIGRGENPPANTTAFLVATIERLAGLRDWQSDA